MYLQGLWGSDTAKTNRQRNIPFTSNLRLKTRTRHGMDCLRTSRYVLSGNWHTHTRRIHSFFFSTFWGHTISIYTLRHICQKRHPTSYVHKVDGWQQTTLRSLGLYFYQPDPDWAFPDVERYCVVCETLGNARTLDGFYLFCVKKISSFSSKCLFSFVVMYSFSFLFCLVILPELYPYPPSLLLTWRPALDLREEGYVQPVVDEWRLMKQQTSADLSRFLPSKQIAGIWSTFWVKRNNWNDFSSNSCPLGNCWFQLGWKVWVITLLEVCWCCCRISLWQIWNFSHLVPPNISKHVLFFMALVRTWGLWMKCMKFCMMLSVHRVCLYLNPSIFVCLTDIICVYSYL